ncbi:MAG: F-type H+-transporting ATPase subunit epsilon [Myxococcota bacterium]|jgi:F-type H+-transporting ATPase subunit epsilon
MQKELQVEIISLGGYLFQGTGHLITIPSVSGQMGIMADHEGILTNLCEGKVEILNQKQEVLEEYEVKTGFAEMFNNRLLILID